MSIVSGGVRRCTKMSAHESHTWTGYAGSNTLKQFQCPAGALQDRIEAIQHILSMDDQIEQEWGTGRQAEREEGETELKAVLFALGVTEAEYERAKKFEIQK